jgi:hypothetical protein
MPSAFRNWKTLPEWVQPDYFRRRRGLGRLKSALVWVTLASAVGASAAAFFVPRSATWLQAGPVSPAHALFQGDCARCHGEAFQTARRFLNWGGSIRAVTNETCTSCHDGPPHNSKQLMERDCASCHREHRGWAALARVPDSDCTSCHADLKVNSSDGQACPFENVSGFPAGHPEFALWRPDTATGVPPPDPGQIHFNHQVHLNPEGVRVEPGGKRTEILDCSNCHQVDATGRYMQPVNYEQHCARCHPLSVRLTGQFDTPELEKAAERFATEPAPHKAPAIVRAMLRDRILRFAQENAVALSTDEPDRPFPKSRRMQPVTSQQWTWAKRELAEMEKVLFFNAQLPEVERELFHLPGGCAYCHVPRPEVAPVRLGELPEFLPTSIRDRWLPHARFRHDAHRMLKCTECHDTAQTIVHESHATADVLMPTVETCARCHNHRVGVGSDCAECHLYHHRDKDYSPSKGWSITDSVGSR